MIFERYIVSLVLKKMFQKQILFSMLLDVSNPCHSNPCGHDGVCESSEQNYRCICAGDYIGKTCDGEKKMH